MMSKKFKSLFVKIEEMNGLRKKIEELLANKRNVALGTDRERLRTIYNKPQTEIFEHGRCSIHGREFINGLYECHKRWEKQRVEKEAGKE